MISLSQVIEILKKDNNYHEIAARGDYFYDYPSADSISFSHLTYDSRDVTADSLFFVKGKNFKKEFLENSITPFYISETDFELAIPGIIVTDVKRALALIALAFYDNPQKKLTTVAITGTKGKTTTSYFIKSILDAADKKTAHLSTAYTTLDGVNYVKSQLTTPESLDLIRMMAESVGNGMTHLVMEVSSQAYLLERVYGLTFDIGIFLNIAPDHIGKNEHKTFENYFYSKRQLIKNSRFMIVNSDMDHFHTLVEEIGEKPHAYYGTTADNRITTDSNFDFSTVGTVAGDFSIQLLGGFNEDNALAAALAANKLGASISEIQKGLAAATVPGRMEVLKSGNGTSIYIDYAHNALSLANLLDVVESHHTGNVTLVLGATGSKGESRRHDFGKLLELHPEVTVILTADDPGNEDPAAINATIASYISRPAESILDREEAIKTALALTTDSNAAIIIAGKGEDHYQLTNGVKLPYIGDVEAVRKYLKN